jgi:uncharacterized protein (TIGR03435 family)
MRIWVWALAACALGAQTVSFDAAAIRPSETAPGAWSGIREDNGYLRASNVTLKRCISGAWEIPEEQITGGPKWAGETRYDITARGAGHRMDMLKSLLADRFRLTLHKQTEVRSGYVLTVAKGGIKATVSAPDTPATTALTTGSRTRIDAKQCSMWRLVQKLAAVLGQPVMNETQDSRRFDFELQWAPAGPSLFTALQEQLGLKLEARKVPVDVLVIDRAELPSEN